MIRNPPLGTEWCGLHDIYYREKIGCCYCNHEDGPMTVMPSPPDVPRDVHESALKEKAELRRLAAKLTSELHAARRYVDEACMALEKAQDIVRVSRRIAALNVEDWEDEMFTELGKLDEALATFDSLPGSLPPLNKRQV